MVNLARQIWWVRFTMNGQSVLYGNRAFVKAIFVAPKCIKNRVFEAEKLDSTKTRLLKAD